MGDPLMRISDLSQVQVLLGVSPGQREELAVGSAGPSPVRVRRGTDHPDRLAGRSRQPADRGGGDLSWERARQRAQRQAPRRLCPAPSPRVEIVVGPSDAALQIPAAALQDGNVWVVDAQGMAHRRPVQVGLQGNGSVEILQGLQAGDKVVTAGATLLSDGVRTRVVGG